jgi:hypothetical protein
VCGDRGEMEKGPKGRGQGKELEPMQGFFFFSFVFKYCLGAKQICCLLFLFGLGFSSCLLVSKTFVLGPLWNHIIFGECIVLAVHGWSESLCCHHACLP